ncbi:MAG: translation initiation factor IF-2 [Anaerolineae bacterium]|nr:translation initiation factor IF-2 [Anaerolineae bacterium]
MAKTVSRPAPSKAPAASTPAPAAPAATVVAPPSNILELPPEITVRVLAERMGVSPIDLLKTLMKGGVMVNINKSIDFDTAALVAEDFGFEVRPEGWVSIPAPEPEPAPVVADQTPATQKKTRRFEKEADRAQRVIRPPVVTIMGHVDHGKTSLLDVIRQTHVAEGEAGGITQHIGAYQVVKQGQKITFIDTPGHAAFTAMRARGAQVTDVAVLVVAADDGVMPQTVEALEHARAAGVPVVVALNKIDKPNASPERVKQQLSDLGLMPDEWGGDTFVVPVSARNKQGIDDLLDAILIVAESEDIAANPNRTAAGTIIESNLDPRRGITATFLVQAGTLRTGDMVVAGPAWGRVKAMTDETGRRIKEAAPSTPVQVLGLNGVPKAGTTFEVVPDERTARGRAEAAATVRTGPGTMGARTIDDILRKLQEGEIKELNMVLKVDVEGSLEPVVNQLKDLATADTRIKLIRAAVGPISESDVALAAASDAIVIGFQVDADNTAKSVAEQQGVSVRRYDVIYKLTEDMEKALKGLLEPVYEDVVHGEAEVRAVFAKGKIAGCYILSGRVTRGSRVRVMRGGEQIHEGRIANLKRLTEDVREVAQGYECGISLENYTDFKEGDRMQFYRRERVF